MNLKKLLLAVICTAMAGSILADGPFREHRYDSFKATPTRAGQTVFVGNSITNMHEWWEAFGSEHSIIGRGNSGGFAYEILPNLESYIDSKPEKFFLMIGTNDISSGESADITARRIRAIVERVKAESPTTLIYVQCILPRANFANSNWAACNEMLHAMYDADDSVTLIDMTEEMMGMSNQDVWSLDRLHPQPKGYATWTHCIEDYVGSTSIYPAGADITAEMQRTNGRGYSYDMRPAQFAFYQVKSGDVLLFGDDLIHGGEWHELLGSPAFKDRGSGWGYGGYNLTQAKTIINIGLRDQQTKPAKIVINYGEGGKDLTNYRLLVDEAKSLAPDAQIYLMNLPPRINTANETDVVSFNNSLRDIATEKGATYIDIYTPLAEDRANNLMNNYYLSGRGYVVVANVLAEAMTDVTTQPVSLTEYEQVYARRTVRSIIGNALTDAFMIEYGTNPGQVKESYRAAITEAITEAAATVNNPDLTEDAATAAAAKLNEAVATAQADMNYPMASTDGNDYWYVLTSARGNKSMTTSEGKLIGGAAPGASTLGWNIWQFIDRGDDTFDLRNANGEYVNPTATFNTQMTVTTTRPDRGFSLGTSNNGTGNFVIYTSNSQINQTGNANQAIFNWYGSSTPDRNDQGCAYAITLFEGTVMDPENAPTQSGWYEIKHAALNKYVTSMETSYRDNATYSYPLQYVATESTSPKQWIYISVNGDTRHVILPNGFYLSDYLTNARTASNHEMTESGSVAGAYDLRYWVNFTRDAHPELPDLVGRTSGARTPHYIRHVKDSELAAFDIWTVRIAANPGAEEINDTKVTLNSTGNRGIATVYNNGTLFLEPGTTFSASDLTIVRPEGVEQENETPQVTIDADTREIRIVLSGEIREPEKPATETLVTGWYCITLQSAQSAQSNRATLVGQMNEAVAAGKTTLFAADNEYEQNAGGSKVYYHVGIGEASALTSPALGFFYVEHPEMTNINIRSQNGHYILPNSTASRTAANIPLSDLTSYNNATLPLCYWPSNNIGCAHDLIGSFSGVSSTWNFSPANLDDYDIYKLVITGESPADAIVNDVKVTLSSPANKGLQSVYNGGAFFVDKGAKITAADLSVPAHGENATPAVTIADGIIAVDYNRSEQSAITEVCSKSNAQPSVVYDLWGRRAGTPRHGVYIVNGQKVRL